MELKTIHYNESGWLVGWHSLFATVTQKKKKKRLLSKRKFSWEKLGSNDEEKEKVI